MASSANTNTTNVTSSTPPCPHPDLKCSKCRKSLSLNNEDVDEQTSEPSLVFLREDNLPEWILVKVEECGWTKTKLHCPHCGARVGGVDFVGAASHHVHLIRSKIDVVTVKVDIRKLTDKQDEASSAEESSIELSTDEQSVSPSPDCLASESDSSASSVDDASDDSSATESSSTSSTSYEVDIDESDLSVASCSSSTSENPSAESDGDVSLEVQLQIQQRVVSKRQRNKLRLKRRRTEKLSQERNRKSQHHIEESRIIKNILEAEPELDDLDHSYICPVCLDLLYEPHKVDPCKHVFCEPCLRRLGSKNPMNTSCPMCRQRIVYCEPQRDFSRSIREDFSSMNIRRKKFERSTNVFSLPLPWRPGWRNLVSGRAMGGNRIATDSNGDALRLFLQQLPYYFPPVLIANLINLFLFVLLLGAFEMVPLIYSLVMGRGMHLSSLAKANSPSADHHLEFTDVEMSTPVDDISAGSGILVDILNGEDASSDDSLPLPTATFAMPESTSPAMDATFYYVLATMSLVAAAFGNFLIIQQQPILAFVPQGTFLDRIYNHPLIGRHFRRFSDLFLIIGLSFVPIVLLPMILPSPSDPPVFSSNVAGATIDANLNLRQTLISYFRSLVKVLILLMDMLNSAMTFQNIVSLAVVYYATSVFFTFRAAEAN